MTRGRALPAGARLVLDTDVVLSALVFRGGSGGSVRAAWQSGRVVPLVSGPTVQELVRVLAYPKFRLDAAAREELLADYLPWTEVVQVPEPPPRVPACRDPHDLPFLHLAAAGRAVALVTGDSDLLALAAPGTRPRLRCKLLSLQAFALQLTEAGG